MNPARILIGPEAWRVPPFFSHKNFLINISSETDSCFTVTLVYGINDEDF